VRDKLVETRSGRRVRDAGEADTDTDTDKRFSAVWPGDASNSH